MPKNAPAAHKNLQGVQNFLQCLQKILQGERRIGRSAKRFSRYAEPQLNLVKQNSERLADYPPKPCDKTIHVPDTKQMLSPNLPSGAEIADMYKKNAPLTSPKIGCSSGIKEMLPAFLCIPLTLHYLWLRPK